MTPKGMRRSFHFGVDVSCRNGTPVYATVSGRVVLQSFRPETVTVVTGDGRTELQYWHIRPAVRNGRHVVAYRTVIGQVLAPWAHVHLAEMHGGVYLNPLRPGAMGPFVDGTRPTITSLRVEQDGRRATLDAARSVDIVVEAFDRTPIRIVAPWNDKPVTPAVIRWRLVDIAGGATTRWMTAVDVRRVIPSDDRYDEVFARWTRQNKAHRPGRYRFLLADDVSPSWPVLAHPCAVQVEATDLGGNRTVRAFLLPGAAAALAGTA